ncbi:hypothetical protein HYU12_01915 [Candidatus Woesearchaeota archaeon]|nr:hypothetical protein [Candidatus Woesearchaeota archaeon]
MEPFEYRRQRKFELEDNFWEESEDDFYQNYEKYLEDDEISAAEAAFLRGLDMADEDL